MDPVRPRSQLKCHADATPSYDLERSSSSVHKGGYKGLVKGKSWDNLSHDPKSYRFVAGYGSWE